MLIQKLSMKYELRWSIDLPYNFTKCLSKFEKMGQLHEIEAS